jgi:hypothetical protein
MFRKTPERREIKEQNFYQMKSVFSLLSWAGSFLPVLAAKMSSVAAILKFVSFFFPLLALDFIGSWS